MPDLNQLLDSLQLGQYKKIFEANDVDYQTFLKLTETDLVELGIAPAAARTLIGAIGKVMQKQRAGQGVIEKPVGRSSTAPQTKMAVQPIDSMSWSKVNSFGASC
jgi:hypothetical protein